MRCLASVPSGTPERRRASSLGGCRIGLPSAYAAVAASARTHRRPRDPRGVRRRDRRRSRPCARKRRSGLRVRRRFAVSNGIRERDDVHFSALHGYSTVAPLGKGDAAQKLFFQHGDNQSGSCTNVFMDKGVDPTFWAIYGITALCFGGAIIAYCRHPHVPFRVFWPGAVLGFVAIAAAFLFVFWRHDIQLIEVQLVASLLILYFVGKSIHYRSQHGGEQMRLQVMGDILRRRQRQEKRDR